MRGEAHICGKTIKQPAICCQIKACVCVCVSCACFKDLHQGSTNKHQVCVFEDRRNEEKKNAAHSCDCDDITLLSCVGRAGVG